VRRRTVLGCLAVAAGLPVPTLAAPKVWRIGVLSARKRPADLGKDFYWGRFLKAMSALGHTEGRDVVLSWRFADGHMDRLPALIAELLATPVDLLVVEGIRGAKAARQGTRSLPTVATTMRDPVGNGVVQDLARPGGNLTGLALPVSGDHNAKNLEYLKLVAPLIRRVGILHEPTNSPSARLREQLSEPARRLGVEIVALPVSGPGDVELAFGRLAREKIDGVLVTSDAVFTDLIHLFASLGLRHRVPVIGNNALFAEVGGLLAHGQDYPADYERVAWYVDRIMRGTPPGELPIEQPTRLHLVVNRRTARTLGLEIPPEVLVLADRVIE
jgi:putative ABC transport system substrate-binding protein